MARKALLQWARGLVTAPAHKLPARAGRRDSLPAEHVGVAISPDDWVARPFLAWARLFAWYHQHRVLHLERLGRLLREGRRVVLVGNHVLDVLDPMLFAAEILRRYGCVPCFIGHENMVFGLPGLREVAHRYGMIPSRHMTETAAALRRDGLLMLYPGSGSEAARRSYRDEPYRLLWAGRLGFLRLALRYDAEILFVAGIGIDEMYYQSTIEMPTALLRLFGSERYEGACFQFGLAGPHVLPGVVPLPVQIKHVVSPPIEIPDREAAARDGKALRRAHEAVWDQCQEFLDRQVARRDRDAPVIDRVVRGGQSVLQQFGI